MTFSKTRIVSAALFGLLVLWTLRKVMDRDSESANAAVQRAWLVVGLLYAGAYVVFSARNDDRAHYQSSSSPKAIAIRYRNLGMVGWAFTIAGSVLAIRLVWQMI